MLSGSTRRQVAYTTTPYKHSRCDSIVETHLTVDSVIYSYDSLSICSGDSALIAGNREYRWNIQRHVNSTSRL